MPLQTLKFFGLQAEQTLLFLGVFKLGVFTQVAVAAGELDLFGVFRNLFADDVFELIFARLITALGGDARLFLFHRCAGAFLENHFVQVGRYFDDLGLQALAVEFAPGGRLADTAHEVALL